MPDYPAPVRHLIDALKKLPGVGPRSAERLALFIMQSEPRLAEELAAAIRSARGGIKNCSRCGSYTAVDPCEICSSPRRDKGLICVVERAADILHVEKTGQFGGVYHALMGKIAPLDGIGPEPCHTLHLNWGDTAIGPCCHHAHRFGTRGRTMPCQGHGKSGRLRLAAC